MASGHMRGLVPWSLIDVIHSSVCPLSKCVLWCYMLRLESVCYKDHSFVLQGWRCNHDVKQGQDEVPPSCLGTYFCYLKTHRAHITAEEQSPYYLTSYTISQRSKPAFESSGVILFLGPMPAAGRKQLDLLWASSAGSKKQLFLMCRPSLTNGKSRMGQLVAIFWVLLFRSTAQFLVCHRAGLVLISSVYAWSSGSFFVSLFNIRLFLSMLFQVFLFSVFVWNPSWRHLLPCSLICFEPLPAAAAARG